MGNGKDREAQDEGAGNDQGPQAAVTICSTLLSMMGVVKQEVRRFGRGGSEGRGQGAAG